MPWRRLRTDVAFLLAELGEGELGQQAVQPHLAEVCLSAPAAERLDAMLGTERPHHSLPDSGLTAEMKTEMKTLSGTESTIVDDPEMLALVLPALRSDYKAAETYQYRTGDMLNRPVFALTRDRDPRAPLADVRAWAEHTEGEFDLQVFPRRPLLPQQRADGHLHHPRTPSEPSPLTAASASRGVRRPVR
ncbi:thioesterase II family protein [Streptomyces sp. NPDC058045]|uniref:thioesterase II family protein n=1 Tax=Streptomyces sp. NPDC058045 TaxID=3346311 RepID=UPI0036E2B309